MVKKFLGTTCFASVAFVALLHSIEPVEMPTWWWCLFWLYCVIALVCFLSCFRVVRHVEYGRGYRFGRVVTSVYIKEV